MQYYNWVYSVEFQWITIISTYVGAFIWLRIMKQMRIAEYTHKIDELALDIKEECELWI